eukprot:TRINITY_DN585_c3_g1_i1.p1 TRINITY_DN585_c3_g1~~TRINITY_DN585_c3_g1_i1.p1  ORF type:complete len:826 (+),score=17.00 TRINITY_DN585_c3_g1_i1:75-2480(+)
MSSLAIPVERTPSQGLASPRVSFTIDAKVQENITHIDLGEMRAQSYAVLGSCVMTFIVGLLTPFILVEEDNGKHFTCSPILCFPEGKSSYDVLGSGTPASSVCIACACFTIFGTFTSLVRMGLLLGKSRERASATLLGIPILTLICLTSLGSGVTGSAMSGIKGKHSTSVSITSGILIMYIPLVVWTPVLIYKLIKRKKRRKTEPLNSVVLGDSYSLGHEAGMSPRTNETSDANGSSDEGNDGIGGVVQGPCPPTPPRGNPHTMKSPHSMSSVFDADGRDSSFALTMRTGSISTHRRRSTHVAERDRQIDDDEDRPAHLLFLDMHPGHLDDDKTILPEGVALSRKENSCINLKERSGSPTGSVVRTSSDASESTVSFRSSSPKGSPRNSTVPVPLVEMRRQSVRSFRSFRSLESELPRHASFNTLKSFQSKIEDEGSVISGVLESRHVVDTRVIYKNTTADGTTTLNDYEVLRELGSGAYSKVRLCKNRKTGEFRAMKIVKKSLMKHLGRLGGRGGLISTALHKVKQEIAILKKARHRNIVTLFEVMDYTDSDKLIMVLEYVPRGPVGTVDPSTGKLLSDPLPEPALQTVLKGVVKGLRYLHGCKILHRDIKPENILISGDGTAKITDFGVSHVWQTRGSDVINRTEGTPAYFPPESLSGGEYKGIPAEVWTLGVTCYVLLTGVLPFHHHTLSGLSGLIKSTHVAMKGFSPECTDIVLRMLHKDPRWRPTLREVYYSQYLLLVPPVASAATSPTFPGEPAVSVCSSRRTSNASSASSAYEIAISETEIDQAISLCSAVNLS